ncbi:hypothetical protein TURU_014878 [Turdus rufiventris]|nr:hypothetical protein TURU_014878 [Turdus rufiventris]
MCKDEQPAIECKINVILQQAQWQHATPVQYNSKVPLDGTLSFKGINCTTQLGVICKLAEGAFDPAVHVIDEDIKQYWCHHRTLKDNSCIDDQKIDLYPLDVTIQPVPHAWNSSPSKCISLKFTEKDDVGTMSKASIQLI